MPAAVQPGTVTPRVRFYPLRVARVDRLCDDASAITFDVPAGLAGELSFRPGQSVTVRRQAGARDERRSYSICSPAGAAPRIGVRAVAGGAVSGWLVAEVRPGDVVEVSPPTGAFTPDLDRPGRHVLVAAGSGITPVLSIAASLLARPGNGVTLLYGNRRAASVMFLDELADLKDAFPGRFEVFHVLSREPRAVEIFSGRLDPAKLHELLPALCDPPRVDHWWLCGPYAMVAGVTGVLAEIGVDAKRVHRELFYVEELPPEPYHHAEGGVVAGAEVTVILDGRSTVTTIPAGTPILDGAQRARSDVPFACKGGVCGTCRARVVDGEVRMRRNFALEPGEVEAGFVLTCQSLPVSDRVTVDFDS